MFHKFRCLSKSNLTLILIGLFLLIMACVNAYRDDSCKLLIILSDIFHFKTDYIIVYFIEYGMKIT